MTDFERGVLFGVEFAKSHYERHISGVSPWTPEPVDPETWWDKMIIVPKNVETARPLSRAHFYENLKLWKDRALEAAR